MAYTRSKFLKGVVKMGYGYIPENRRAKDVRIDNYDKKVRERSKITQELRQAGTKEKQIPKTGKVIKSKNLLGSDKTQSPAKLTKTVKSVMKSSVVSRVKKSKKR